MLRLRQLNFPSQLRLTLFFEIISSEEIYKKMSIFGNFIFLPIMTSFDPQGGWRNTIFRTVYTVLFGLFYLSTSIFIAMNLRSNIGLALYDVSIINGNSAFILTYFYLVIYREQFHSLVDDMENIVHKSVWKKIALVRIHCLIHCDSVFILQDLKKKRVEKITKKLHKKSILQWRAYWL